jgi:hypothetical protein
MKNINKKIAFSIIGIIAGFSSCKGPFDQDPNLTTNGTPSAYTANFVFVNAVPDDASGLDLYINNLKVGASVPSDSAQSISTNVPITSNGVFANTGIRAKATTATIGGVLGSSDLIFRSTSTSSNNFQASNAGYYTLIAVDTVNRPLPVRTLDAGNFGNTTYYSAQSSFTGKGLTGQDTTINLTIGSNNSIVLYNLVKKANNNVAPSFLIPIGIIPLGSSDPGGSRFLLYSDAIPTPITSGKFAARFVNASPDAGAITVTVNGTTLAGQLTYPMTQANFNPSVGSRSATLAFTNNFAAAGSYSVVVKAGTTTITKKVAFADQGVYTIVLTGRLAKNTLNITVAQNK